MQRSWGFCRVAALGATLAVLSLSCSYYSHYDDEPTFVRQLEDLKAECVRAGERAPTASEAPPTAEGAATLPSWHDEAGRPLLPKAESKRPMTLDDLYVNALQHSHQIQVFSDMPLIRETGIQEAEGTFDVHAYVESEYDRMNEGVGSTLVSTIDDRFIEHKRQLEVGLRKKVITGADVSIAQRFLDKDSNADYFVPERQDSAALTVRIVQPLLAGGGIRYNKSVLHLARLDSEIAQAEMVRQAESHLLEVARGYWSLYAARAVYCQYVRQAEAIEGILKELKARADADALRHQILRAEAGLTNRRADLVRAELAILNAQDRLHALVNEDVGWSQTEIIPISPIHLKALPMDTTRSGTAALENRPEVQQAFLQLRAAAVRLGMNKNEILPKLSLILEGRLHGLEGGRHLGDAVGEEWEVDDTVGGTIGIVLDVPLGNNTAAARLKRRKIEMRQQFNQLRTTVDTVLLEVRISVREATTGWRDFTAKSEAARAAHEEVEHLLARKDIEAMRAPASTYLGDLMAAQDREADAQRALAQTMATYQVAVLNLQRAQGTLLGYTKIGASRSEQGDLPVIRLEKGSAPSQGGK